VWSDVARINSAIIVRIIRDPVRSIRTEKNIKQEKQLKVLNNHNYR
jgi:hypothetical protein